MPDNLGEREMVDLPPGVLDELIRRIEQVEQRQAALEGAINAFITVYAVRRLPDQPSGGGDESTG